MLRKNKINPQQLIQAVQKFSQQIQVTNPNKFVEATVRNIQLGLEGKALHDTWTIGDDSYCLCRYEIDSDGGLVYTAYQLYLAPPVKGWANVRSILRFLKFYAQKHQCNRFNLISSRLDSVKAYARGIGSGFKPKYLIFSQEI